MVGFGVWYFPLSLLMGCLTVSLWSKYGQRSERGGGWAKVTQRIYSKTGMETPSGVQAGFPSLHPNPQLCWGWGSLSILFGSQCSEQSGSGEAVENGFTQPLPWAAHFGNHL